MRAKTGPKWIVDDGEAWFDAGDYQFEAWEVISGSFANPEVEIGVYEAAMADLVACIKDAERWNKPLRNTALLPAPTD